MSDTKTLGEARIRTDFNASGSETVDILKRKGAELIDLINELNPPDEFPQDKMGEFLRIKAMALSDIESGTSWAVKTATTKKDTF